MSIHRPETGRAWQARARPGLPLILLAALASAATTAHAADDAQATPAGSTAPGPLASPGAGAAHAAPSGLPRWVQRSADDGIVYRASAMLEFAGNVSGGIRRGNTLSPYLTVGTDLDLDTLAGWRGASLHATIIAERSDGTSRKYIGGGVDVQENYAPFNIFRFMTLTLDQRLSLRARDDLTLTAGRMGMTSYFARNAYTCTFLNHTFCGPMYGFTQSTGTAVAPVASWGGVARLQTGARTYVQAGVFAVDAATLEASTRLMDLGGQGIHGTDYLAEVGYESPSAQALKGHYRLGLSYLDSARNDVYLNTRGLPFLRYGGDRLQHRDQSAAYFTADQVIHRSSALPERNLALFGSYYQNFQTSEAIADTWKLGIVKTGTFASRDSDTLGFALSQVAFTAKEVDALSALRASGGGEGRVRRDEWISEVDYGYQVRPGLVLRPNVQWLLHPDSRYTPTHPTAIPSALVVGLQVSIGLDRLANLPRS